MNIGKWLLIAGISLILGSCIPVGVAFQHGFSKNIAKQSELEIGLTNRTGLFHVNTEQLVQATIKLNIQAPTDQNVFEDGEEGNDKQYSIPVSYRILNQFEEIIQEKNNNITWKPVDDTSPSININYNSSTTTSTSSGSTYTIDYTFEKIKIDPPGEIQVEITLSPTSTYPTVINSASLMVYDDVYTYWDNIFSALGLAFIGFIVTLVGLILLITQPTTRSTKREAYQAQEPIINNKPQPQQYRAAPSNNQVSREDDQSLRWAMLTHLSTYSGFIVPFGGLIGPLIVWLMKKDEYPYIDAHGREALNFRISIYIYTVISFFLAFFGIGFLLLAILFVIDLIVPLVAGIQANSGKFYRYPLTIRFIKDD